MSRVILKRNNEVLDRIELRQGDMKIGRKPGCDIHLDNLAVSGEHANIFTIGDDSFIQDLGSTNGTFINNKRISKHHLHNGDAITIGEYTLVFMGEAAATAADKGDFAKTVIISAPIPAPPPREPAPAPAPAPAVTEHRPAAPAAAAKSEHQAALMILTGPNTGKRLEVTKQVTNLGRTGVLAGTITRMPDGFVLAPTTGSAEAPKLNGRAVPSEGIKLKNGDVIDVAGTRLQFYLR
jgi:predicted component of type VI protein secretion system